MRILCATLPVSAHFQPLAIFGRAALLRGHEVAVCTAPELAGEVEAAGLRHLPAGRDWITPYLAPMADLDEIPRARMQELMAEMMAELFPGEPALAVARDVIEQATAWRPDVVVREACELGGYLAAEALGLPHVSVGAPAGSAFFLLPDVMPRLDEGRRALGLEPDPEGSRVYGYLHANLMPPSYDPGELVIPNLRSYRLPVERPDEQLPDWIDEWHGQRPLVFASLGTLVPAFPAYHPVLRAIVEGLGQLDCNAIVTVGAGNDPELVGPAAANTRVVTELSQPLVLELADAFVTHAGYTSAREALRLGVPMVTVPLIVDNDHVAACCEAIGAGLTLDFETLTAAQLRDACARVLEDPAYRTQARAVQRQILTLPSVTELVDDVERVAAAGPQPPRGTGARGEGAAHVQEPPLAGSGAPSPAADPDPRPPQSFLVLGGTYVDDIAWTSAPLAFDLTLDVRARERTPGGPGLCLATALRRLGQQVRLATVTGTCADSERALEHLGRERVETLVQQVPGTLDGASLVLDPEGESLVLSQRRLPDLDVGAPDVLDAVAAADTVLVCSPTSLRRLAPHREALELPTVVLNLHARQCRELWTLDDLERRRVLDLADLLVVNEPEAELLEGVPGLQAVPAVVVTRGARGCTLRTRDGRLAVPAVPGPVARPVNVNGAGEAFVAALLATLAPGGGWQPSLRAAACYAWFHIQEPSSLAFPRMAPDQLLALSRKEQFQAESDSSCFRLGKSSG